MNKTNTPTPEEARAIASDAKFHCKDSENPRPVQTDSSVEDATATLTALVSNPSEAEEIPDAKYFPADCLFQTIGLLNAWQQLDLQGQFHNAKIVNIFEFIKYLKDIIKQKKGTWLKETHDFSRGFL